MSILTQIVDTLGTPLEIVLFAILIVLLYKVFLSKYIYRWTGYGDSSESDQHSSRDQQRSRLPPLKKQDMTVEELSQYDGVKNEDGRICIAADGKIFDVTMAKHLYGKNGPYGIFAGHDASRGLATFNSSAEVVKDTYDDLFDLTPSEMDSVREWAAQFKEKYPVVGRLLKPGEQPDIYSDEEESASQSSSVSADTISQKDKQA